MLRYQSLVLFCEILLSIFISSMKIVMVKHFNFNRVNFDSLNFPQKLFISFRFSNIIARSPTKYFFVFLIKWYSLLCIFLFFLFILDNISWWCVYFLKYFLKTRNFMYQIIFLLFSSPISASLIFLSLYSLLVYFVVIFQCLKTNI